MSSSDDGDSDELFKLFVATDDPEDTEPSEGEICYQCSVDLYDETVGDFAGLANEGDAAFVNCAGCGKIAVNHEGKCVSPECPLHGEGTTDVQ